MDKRLRTAEHEQDYPALQRARIRSGCCPKCGEKPVEDGITEFGAKEEDRTEENLTVALGRGPRAWACCCRDCYFGLNGRAETNKFFAKRGLLCVDCPHLREEFAG